MGGGGSKTEVVNNTPAPSEEEKQLTQLNIQLASKQLEQIDQLQPFQQELLNQSLAQLKREAIVGAAVTPEQQAALAKSEFERMQKMGPIQDELMQMQLDQLRSGGAATPEQLARIKAATDAGIAAGGSDIDAATKEGIGMIADELANSRGLRLSDSPLSSEAALLARSGQTQKASLSKNLRASEASAALNYPLAVQQMQSGINMGQQNLNQSIQQFQQQLQQQAYQNRVALTGSTGLGLAGVGNGVGAQTLNTLSNARMNSGSKTTNTSNKADMGQTIGTIGSAVGVGFMIF